MANYKNERIAEDIKREISASLRTLKDPRIPEFVSITEVEVTRDMSYAKVYISVLNGDANEAQKGLEQAGGFIRSQLSKLLKLRHTPQLIFIADNSISYGAHINKIIEDLKK